MIPELVNSVFSTDNSMKDEDTLQMMTVTCASFRYHVLSAHTLLDVYYP